MLFILSLCRSRILWSQVASAFPEGLKADLAESLQNQHRDGNDVDIPLGLAKGFSFLYAFTERVETETDRSI